MAYGTIHKTVTYPHPPEMVWAALTDADALSAWLMPNDFRAEVGHTFTFRTDPAPGFDGVVRCEVLELEPPKHWKISWKGGGIDTILNIRLTATAAGQTRLDLAHSGFAARDVVPRVILGFGWSRITRKKIPNHLRSLS